MRHYAEDEQASYQSARQVGTPNCVIGIDPGPEQSGYAVLDRQYRCLAADKTDLACLYGALREYAPRHVVIEGVVIYQKSAHTLRETAYRIGRIQRECELMRLPYTMIDRQTYVTALCGGRGNDTMLRAALELRFGGYGKGGPLALLKGCSDKRSAYAVAAYWLDGQRTRPH